MNETETEDSSDFPQDFSQWLSVHLLAASQVWKDLVENTVLASIAITHLLILYTIIGALTYIYVVYCSRSKTGEKVSKRVLFVIAHPDDECMFFGPTILSLKNDNEVYLLCLSIGDHYKKGSVRKEELYKSCKVFGIPQSNIIVMNNTRMPDKPDVIWNAQRTAKILLDHIESLSIDEVYTFDNGGVSGHLNHISIYYGFARLCVCEDIPSRVKVFLLDSVNKIRKYSVVSDAVISALPLNTLSFIVPVRDSHTIREAMYQHKSQMVWYRAAYIYLSRYMYMNTYSLLEIEDVHLILQMNDIDYVMTGS